MMYPQRVRQPPWFLASRQPSVGQICMTDYDMTAQVLHIKAQARPGADQASSVAAMRTCTSHFSTAPPVSEGLMRFFSGTTSPSTLIMAVMSALGWNLRMGQGQTNIACALRQDRRARIHTRALRHSCRNL